MAHQGFVRLFFLGLSLILISGCAYSVSEQPREETKKRPPALSRSTRERTFEATLSGNEEVPPVSTVAKGTVTFKLNNVENHLTYRLSISHIRDVIDAHIHQGKQGQNGPPVIDLFSEPRKENIGGTLLVEGKIEPYLFIGPLKEKPLHALIELVESGESYVNVHTKKHPEGEIRGQIK
jgi:hypothetical protein